MNEASELILRSVIEQGNTALQAGLQSKAQSLINEGMPVVNLFAQERSNTTWKLRSDFAFLLRQMGHLDEALNIYDALLSETDSVTDISQLRFHLVLLLNKIEICEAWREYDQAIELFLDAIRYATHYVGEKHAITIEVMEMLGKSLINQHKYSEAIDIFTRTANFKRQSIGEYDPEYADTLNELGIAYDQSGYYREAGRYFRQAYSIRKSTLGEADSRTITTRFNIAELSRIEGDYVAAEKGFLELLSIEIAANHQDKTMITLIQNNLGELYLFLGRNTEAKPLLEEAYATRRAFFGEKSRYYARSLSTLANLYVSESDYAQARVYAQSAHNIYVEQKDIQQVTTCDWILAQIEALDTDDVSTLKYVCESAETLVNYIGKNHPNSRTIYIQVAKIHLSYKNFAGAREYFVKGMQANSFLLTDLLTVTSRSGLAVIAQDWRITQTQFLSSILNGPAPTDMDICHVFEYVQQCKAVETRALGLYKPENLIFTGQDGQLSHADYASRVTRILSLRQKLVRLNTLGDAVAGDGKAKSDINELQGELDTLERYLAEHTTLDRVDWELLNVSAQTISIALPPNSILIEYVRIEDHVSTLVRNGTKRPDRYVAFVVKAYGDSLIHRDKTKFMGLIDFDAAIDPDRPVPMPKLFDLGDAGEIDTAINQFRDELDYVSNKESITPDWIRRGRYLYKRLIKPLEEEIAKSNHIIIAPDGSLGILPFGLLSGEAKLLMDTYLISYVLMGSEIRRFVDIIHLSGKPLVFAAPDYDLLSKSRESPETSSTDKPLELPRRSNHFIDLPEARKEGETIAGLLEVPVLTGADATEFAFLHSESPEIIHIASHGFYILKSSDVINENGSNEINLGFFPNDTLKLRAHLNDPMERSGLALAGANAFLEGRDLPSEAGDGLLFASEVVDLDLRATDLVVLSACQTGMGDIYPGDGIQGLRRGFKGAGCLSIVSSLWNVPDAISCDLMTLFYSKLLEGATRIDALYYAQKAIRNKYPDDPICWGGVILEGDPRPLARFNPISELSFGFASLKNFKTQDKDKKEQPESPTSTMIASRFYRRGLRLLSTDAVAAITAFTNAIETKDVTITVFARSLYERAGVFRKIGNFEAALNDYEKLLSLKGITPGLLQSTLYDRGTTHLLSQNFTAAIKDYSDFIAFPDITQESLSKALVNRGGSYEGASQYTLAIADFTRVLEFKGAPRIQRYKALTGRAQCFLDMQDYSRAVEDITLALTLDEGTPDEHNKLRYVRADSYRHLGNIGQALADLEWLLNEKSAQNLRAGLLFSRGSIYYEEGEIKRAKVDLEEMLLHDDVSDQRKEKAQKIIAECSQQP